LGSVNFRVRRFTCHVGALMFSGTGETIHI
jgi:hypothetical protein